MSLNPKAENQEHHSPGAGGDGCLSSSKDSKFAVPLPFLFYSGPQLSQDSCPHHCLLGILVRERGIEGSEMIIRQLFVIGFILCYCLR